MVVMICPPAGTKARSMVVAEFIPEEETRQSSAPSSSLSFSSTTRVVGLPYLSQQWDPSVHCHWLCIKAAVHCHWLVIEAAVQQGARPTWTSGASGGTISAMCSCRHRFKYSGSLQMFNAVSLQMFNAVSFKTLMQSALTISMQHMCGEYHVRMELQTQPMARRQSADQAKSSVQDAVALPYAPAILIRSVTAFLVGYELCRVLKIVRGGTADWCCEGV